MNSYNECMLGCYMKWYWSKKSFEHPIVQMDIHGVKTMVYSWLKYAKKLFTKNKIAKD
jgi:hypothetical protein